MTGEKMNSSETESEHVPTIEEVQAVLKELIGDQYTEVRRGEDERGLYLLDVTIPGEKDGELTGYEYMRAGRYPEGNALETAIEIVYYENEIPVGGTIAAKYLNGEWKIFS
jgi:hypothetical protein